MGPSCSAAARLLWQPVNLFQLGVISQLGRCGLHVQPTDAAAWLPPFRPTGSLFETMNIRMTGAAILLCTTVKPLPRSTAVNDVQH
jgi:hypothetical protein